MSDREYRADKTDLTKKVKKHILKEYKKKKLKGNKWKYKGNIVDTAKEATDFIKKEFPKIGTDY